MLIHPFKKVYITQEFGKNPDIYSRFGYKGHNGIDYRLFDENGNRSSTSKVYAPHDGIIKERRNDEDGYGLYLKLESDKEGSVLGHLKEFLVNVNKNVKQGDLIAIADNTGWSTGSHLHWGYYKLPRNRANGYGGFIDQSPYIGIIEDKVEITSKTKIPKALLNGTHFKAEKDMEIQAIKSTLNDQVKNIKGLERDKDNFSIELVQIKLELKDYEFNSISEMGEAYQELKEVSAGPLARLGAALDKRFGLRASHVAKRT